MGHVFWTTYLKNSSRIPVNGTFFETFGSSSGCLMLTFTVVDINRYIVHSNINTVWYSHTKPDHVYWRQWCDFVIVESEREGRNDMSLSLDTPSAHRHTNRQSVPRRVSGGGKTRARARNRTTDWRLKIAIYS